MLFLVHMTATYSSILFKKFKTNQTRKDTGYAFKGFVLAALIK
jgi:hypothetical protein